MKHYILVLLLVIFSYNLYANETTVKLKAPGFDGVNVLKTNSSDLVYAGTWGDGIYTSADAGVTFQKKNIGLTNMFINAIFIDKDDNVYAGTQGGGLFVSTNDGNLWTQLPFNTNLNVTAVCISPFNENLIYVGTYGSGLFVSSDAGQTWTSINRSLNRDSTFTTIETYHITAIAQTEDSTLLVGTYGDGVYRSVDMGNNWRRANSGTGGTKFINEFEIVSKNMILMATNDKGLMESNNGGLMWARYAPAADSIIDDAITCVVYNGEFPIVGTREAGCWYYNEIPYFNWIPSTFRQYSIVDMTRLSNGQLLCFEYSIGLLRSTDNGANWKYASMLQTKINKDIVSDGTNYYMYSSDKLYKSTDIGVTWTELTSYEGGAIDHLKYSNGKLLVIKPYTLLISSDGGTTWSSRTPGDSDDGVMDAVITDNGNLFLILNFFINATPPSMPTVRRELHKSTDYGATWTKVQNEPDETTSNARIETDGNNNLYYYTENNDGSRTIRVSVDLGATFTNSGYSADVKVEEIKSKFNTLYLATKNGLYVSNDQATTFSLLNIPIEPKPYGFFQPDSQLVTMAIVSPYEYYVGFKGPWGVYHTTNAGVDWDSLQSGFYTSRLKAMSVNSDGDLIFVGGLADKYLNWKKMGVPQLTSPENNAQNLELDVKFDWETSNKAELYELQFSDEDDFRYSFEDIIQSGTDYDVFYRLLPNTKYYWRVRGKTGGVYSPWSQVYSFTTIMAAPNLIAPVKDTISVPLTTQFIWSKVDSAKKYRLYIATDSLLNDIVLKKDGVVDTTYSLTDVEKLTPLTQYYWAVAAQGNDGSEGKLSEIWNFKTILGSPVLLTPENNIRNTANSLTFTWEEVTGAADYQIQISRQSDFSINALDAVTNNITSQLLSQLAYNTNYYWRVRAKDSNNAYGAWSEIWTFRVGQESPTLISPENNSGGQPTSLTLDWSDIEGYKYDLQVSLTPDFTPPLVVELSAQVESEYDLSSLEANKTYYWRVRAVLNDTMSAWTEAWNFSTGLARTVLLLPADSSKDLSKTSILFKWEPTKGATRYKLQISRNDSFTNYFYDDSTITTSSKDVYDFEVGQTYYWRVQASDGQFSNDYSEVWSFTIKKGPNSVAMTNEVGISVYPNPVQNEINMQIPNDLLPVLNKATIISQTGKQIMEQSISSSLQRLNLSTIPSGTYYLILEGKRNKYLFKFNKIK